MEKNSACRLQAHKNVWEVKVKYPKPLHKLDNNLPFLAETMKIENFNKLVCNLFNNE